MDALNTAATAEIGVWLTAKNALFNAQAAALKQHVLRVFQPIIGLFLCALEWRQQRREARQQSCWH